MQHKGVYDLPFHFATLHCITVTELAHLVLPRFESALVYLACSWLDVAMGQPTCWLRSGAKQHKYHHSTWYVGWMTVPCTILQFAAQRHKTVQKQYYVNTTDHGSQRLDLSLSSSNKRHMGNDCTWWMFSPFPLGSNNRGGGQFLVLTISIFLGSWSAACVVSKSQQEKNNAETVLLGAI